MRKILCIYVMLFLSGFIFAQDTVVNKKGETMLPKAGDIAIGIEATPFFQYLGNFLNNTANNLGPALNFLENNFLGNTTLYGKYFLEDKKAVRVNLEITTSNAVTKQYVRDDNAYYADQLSKDRVVDIQKLSSSYYVLGLGYELRRGRGRLQGFYGGGVMFGIGNSQEKYTYGNPYSQVYPNPTDYNFGTNLNFNDFNGVLGDRKLTVNNGRSFGFGLDGFIGIEYFFIPNISVGGELGWRLFYEKDGKSKITYETWNGTASEEKIWLTSPGNKNFDTYTSNPTVGIFVMFHF